ncbi:MAG: hypothetical protein DRQ44_14930 [Gammaproteobacteria bacterium]|nr:MAG: hypothetical protein DRQ44_14930 [Gammaproteobacteria bacterium]
MVITLCVFSAFVFADGETTEVFLTGSSNSPAGDFVVQTTNDMFHYQGREYEVYRVYYDDPDMNMKIAVNSVGECTSFVAFNGEFMFFYNCNKHGFGVRKVMFSNPWVKDDFDAEQFHDQTVLMKKKKVEKKQAVGLIASYVPQLKG